MMRRLIAVAVCLFAVAGCGSASDAVTFTAPPDYKAAASIGPFAQIWNGPDHNTMMLMAIPTRVDISKHVTQSPVGGGGDVVSDKAVTICDDQPARLADMHGEGISVSVGGSAAPTSVKGRRQDVEFLLTVVNGKTYMAIYSRPLGSAPDRAAEAALHNVCPKPQ